ncbi:MAG: DUF86 domain-containing protein [Jiangellales bacterium]
MVDELRVARLLRAARDDVATLRTEADTADARRSEPLWMAGVKYLFITAIEACVDIAQHICASEGWGPPATNADAFRVLARHDVVSSELADALGRAVGFRNVLVHDYVDVDDEIVLRRMSDLADLEQFTAAVAAWMTRPSGGQ